MQVVERWILTVLRRRTFFSLGELNAAIARMLERLNMRPFRELPGSRRSLFEQLDRPAFLPLPTERYVFAEWKKARCKWFRRRSQRTRLSWERFGRLLERSTLPRPRVAV